MSQADDEIVDPEIREEVPDEEDALLSKPTDQMTPAEIGEALRKLNRLIAWRKRVSKPTLRVSEKGAVALYGVGRYPLVLYKAEWRVIFQYEAQIREFLEANFKKLSHLKLPRSLTESMYLRRKRRGIQHESGYQPTLGRRAAAAELQRTEPSKDGVPVCLACEGTGCELGAETECLDCLGTGWSDLTQEELDARRAWGDNFRRWREATGRSQLEHAIRMRLRVDHLIRLEKGLKPW